MEKIKVGLEIHQQLNTHKLFCSCPSELDDNFDFVFERELKPVVSETGNIDLTAQLEARKGSRYIYLANKKNSCAVEWDEEPPHMPNKEALEIVFKIAKAFNAKIVDEIIFMRKMILDGSVVSGFQRTALIAYDGKIDDVKIETICLEEDSARKVDYNGKKAFLLDRLGIPLIEITTAPDIDSGEKARDIAKKIGEILRMTKVKRGLGTIRQDLNVSIENGARVEIKGVQDLDLIPEIIKKEAERQKSLLKLRSWLNKVEFSEIKELTHIFVNTESKILKNKKIFGICLKNANNLFAQKLHENKHFGKEIAEYVKAFGYKGYIHSDEKLEKYRISNEEINKVRETLNCKKDDLFILVANDKEIIDLIIERIEQFKRKIPEETRKANEDGSTSFMRPISTNARLYPETDIPPIKPFEVDKIEMPEERKKRLEKIIGKEYAERIYLHRDYDLFKEFGEDKLAADFVLNILPNMRKKYKIDKERIKQVLKLVREGKIGKESILDAYISLLKTGKVEIVNIEEIREKIKKIVNERKDYIKTAKNPINGLMGLIMREVKGKANGKIIMQILKEEIEKIN